MNNIPLMKMMALADEADVLITESFTTIERRCDTRGQYHRDGDVSNDILLAIKNLRELRKEIRNLVIENEIT